MTTRRNIIRGLSLTGLSLGMGLPVGARAQSSGTTKYLIGTPAGGAIDAYVRPVAEHMSRTLGLSYIVENKAGAGGNIAAQSVVDAPADGLSIWAGTQAMTEINPAAYDNLKWSMKDFAPIIRGIEAPLVLVTHPSVQAKTFDDLIAWIRSQPGKLSYASFSPGTQSHFLPVQMAEKFKLDMAHLPYRGSAPQVNDLLAGHALFGFSQVPSVLPHVQAGKLNAIVVTSAKRFRAFPDVPSIAEVGHPDLVAMIWFGLLAKAGTPSPVLERLTAAAKAAHADPAVRAILEPQGYDISGVIGEEFGRDIAAGAARWAKLVQATGFRAAN